MKIKSINYAEVINSFCKTLLQRVEVPARTMGERSQPPLTGGSYASSFEEFHMLVQAKLDWLASVLKPNTTMLTAFQATKTEEHESIDITNRQSALRLEQIDLDSQLNDLIPSTRTRPLLIATVWTAIIGGCLFDGLFSMRGFQHWGATVLESGVFGAIFGALTGLYAHFAPWIYFHLGTTRMRKIFTLGLLILLALIAFTIVGQARADYLTDQATRDGINETYHPWAFIGFSSFMMVIAICLPLRHLPTEEELV